MPLAELLNALKDTARPGLIGALTGKTQEMINEDLGKGVAPITSDPDMTSAPLHSLTNKYITDEHGGSLAAILGILNEIPPAVSAAANDKPVFTHTGEEGFSLADLRSNYTGQRASALERGESGPGAIADTVGGIAGFTMPNSGPSAGAIASEAAKGVGPLVNSGLQNLIEALRRKPEVYQTTQPMESTSIRG